MAKGDEIQERLVALAAGVVALCNALPKGTAGSHLANQLLRSGTSPAPNYAEARGAESDRDFAHKLRIVLKELNETEVWFQILIRTQLVSSESIQPIREECVSLSRIIAASIRTMKQRGVTATG
jgi:four helix bundle protein